MNNQKQRRPGRWNVLLLNDLSKASGKNHNTIRTSVKHLAETLRIELPKIREQTLKRES